MPSYNILIVCWDFPPNKAIGGRRWAKMAKSFLKLGSNVFVINKRSPKQNIESAWINGDIYSRLKIHSIDENIFVKWLNDYSSPLKAIKIRIARAILSRLSKGTIYDRALGIEDKFLKKASEIITQNKIDLVCVTGAPFNLLYYTSKLKSRFPHVKFVADYRDPWINAQNYGMRALTADRKKEELRKQDSVFENMDHITAPNSFLLEEIKATYVGKRAVNVRFTELPHAFDPDDVVSGYGARGTGQISIIYAGALYIGSEPYLELLNESVSYVKRKSDLKFSISIYTDDVAKKKIFERNSDAVVVAPSIHHKVFEKTAGSDLIIILLSEHNKNYLTSKFFEFLPYRKPFLYLGPKGHVHDKILKENLGFVLEKKEDLLEILKMSAENAAMKSDIGSYTFDRTAANFLAAVMK